MKIKKDLTTRQVSALFDVNESTVRRWAMSGRIKCSVSAGGHRKFSHEDIVSFAIGKGIQINSTQYSESNRKSVITKIVNLTFQNNVKSIELILIDLYLNGVQLSDLMDNYLEPVLIRIQKRLDAEKISIAQEHLARKVVSQSINNLRNSVISKDRHNGKNILCLNLENDIPDIPIDMIDMLLQSVGYSVDNCGSNTSIKNLTKLLLKNRYDAIFVYLCDRQCCSATVHKFIDKTNRDLSEIKKLAKKYNIALFLGGPSFKNISECTLKGFNLFSKYSDCLNISKLL